MRGFDFENDLLDGFKKEKKTGLFKCIQIIQLKHKGFHQPNQHNVRAAYRKIGSLTM